MIKRSIRLIFIKTKNYLIYMALMLIRYKFPKKNLLVKESSFRYFLWYNDDNVIRPLCLKLPQMIGYVKQFDSNKTLSFKINDNTLLKKYTKNMEKS